MIVQAAMLSLRAKRAGVLLDQYSLCYVKGVDVRFMRGSAR